MQLVSSSDVSISFILSMLFDLGITLIPMALPLAVFFSTIFCIGKISGDSEYIALRSFGVTKLKVLMPFILVALLTGLATFFINQELVPKAHLGLRKKISIVGSASLIQGIKSGQFFTTIPNVTMFPQVVDKETNELTSVFLQMYDSKNKEEKVIRSKRGKIIHEKDEKTGLETFKLLLLDGNISSIALDNSVEKILFKEYSLPISSQRFSYKASTKEISMSGVELYKFVNQGFDKAISKGFKKRLYINATFEFWNRLNTVILVVLFTFLGFALGVKATRSRGQNSGAKAILYLVGYYTLFFGLVSLGKSRSIPMYVAVFLPSIVLYFFTLKKYKKLDWQS